MVVNKGGFHLSCSALTNLQISVVVKHELEVVNSRGTQPSYKTLITMLLSSATISLEGSADCSLYNTFNYYN